LRRTRAAFIYEQTKDLEVVRQVLGHKSLAATQAYLGVNEAKAHDIAGKYRL
jgi:site-specific recombinase XerD